MGPPKSSNIAPAIRLACRVARGADRVESLLRLALEASGSERAFLLSARPGEPDDFRLVARCSRRGDDTTAPSRSLSRRALAGSRPVVSLDLPDDRSLTGASIRALALRTVIAAPLDSIDGDRGALVLDSREASDRSASALCEIAQSFAGLIGLALPKDRNPALAPPRQQRSVDREPRYPSESYRRMIEWIERVAPSRLPVFICGESGSGKEGVARTIHRRSARSAGPFVAVNCSALTETLLDSELFGAVRGAYTGADRDRPGLFREADGGTLFLDEIGDMPASMQSKLLRVLEERSVRPVGAAEEHEVDVRVLAASHRDLTELVASGAFRADLFWRLAVLRVNVPPLRERLADLPRLVGDLEPRLRRETGFGPSRLSRRSRAMLERHSWPGNVRELHAVLARALLASCGGEIRPEHIGTLASPVVQGAAGDDAPLERAMIAAALARANGSVTEAAARIGWSRQKLYRRMALFKL